MEFDDKLDHLFFISYDAGRRIHDDFSPVLLNVLISEFGYIFKFDDPIVYQVLDTNRALC
jgi:hypothetical protein